MRKFKTIASWVFILLYLAVTVGFVKEHRRGLVISGLEIRITDSVQNRFISSSDVKALIRPRLGELMGKKADEVNTCELEKILYTHPVVKKASVYKTAGGILHIELSQRMPLIRIINAWNNDYYIDVDGRIMPWSGRFTAFVPVANGNIRYRFQNGKEYNVRDTSLGIISDLYTLGMFLKENKFWNAQIEQIYINSKDEIELIPRVGAQLIILGSMENYEQKFRNLKALYDRGFGEAGWNAYKTINLKYNNQIICTKRSY